MSYDVIIIGGGLGGLTAGAVLAKKQKRVLLLEQHYILGGAATIFKRKDIHIEVGLHQMDYGKYGYDIKRDLFDFLELDKKIELISLPEIWGVVDKNKKYVVPQGIEEAKKYFISQFPSEEKGIKKIF
jgi:phytoene dehydrogenase-like protein